MTHDNKTTPDLSKAPALARDVIAMIQNEQNEFDMSYYLNPCAPDLNVPATCGTASCMAGYIEACRPELAAQLAPKFTQAYYKGCGELDHAGLAAAIWRRETGTSCTLDFLAKNTDGMLNEFDDPMGMSELTREDAVQHILGTHPEWEQLADDPYVQDYEGLDEEDGL